MAVRRLLYRLRSRRSRVALSEELRNRSGQPSAVLLFGCGVKEVARHSNKLNGTVAVRPSFSSGFALTANNVRPADLTLPSINYPARHEVSALRKIDTRCVSTIAYGKAGRKDSREAGQRLLQGVTSEAKDKGRGTPTNKEEIADAPPISSLPASFDKLQAAAV